MRVSHLPVVSLTAAALALGPGASALASQEPPSPAAFHGYELGTRYTRTDALYDYYRALAQASPRVEYREYGRTIQGRPLPMVMIGSEVNLARRDEILEATRRIGGVDGPISAQALGELSEETPAVVWIFIVDTDEEAGVEVLQEVAYELATGAEGWAPGLLDDVLVVMTPLTNPDSHARYVTWHGIYDVDGAATDPQAVENSAHWAMNTDGNAWGVDVNRDFGWFVTPEMRALAGELIRWRPEIVLDVHSGPDVIFLPPFPRPWHPLWPDAAPEWWNAVAERANERFGEKGWSFSSRKDYEGVAGVGFGLSWAMLGPSVSALLFETFGGRPGKTTAFIRSDGTRATMRMAMDRHKEAIRSLLDVVRARKAGLFRQQRDRVAAAMEEARRGRVRSVVIPAEGPEVDPVKVARLVDRLLLQEIRVRRATAPFALEVRDFLDLGRAPASQEFPAGTYVVDLVQPNARLARALLDPTVDFSHPTVEVPYDRKMPYYDAPWGNLPFLFGVQAWAGAEAPQAAEEVTAPRPSEGTVEGLERTEPPYAWVLRPGYEAGRRVAVALVREGYRMRVFRSGFRIRGEDFPKGTMAFLRIRNPEGLGERIEALAEEEGARVVAAEGPFTEAGLTFGDDRRLAAVPEPRVAVVADRPVTHDHTYGGIRATLEGVFGLPFSPVMLETLVRGDLSEYTTVVLPHAGMSVRGGPNFNAGYRGRLDLGRIREWVRNGGTLVAVQGAAEVVAADPVLGAGLEVDGWAERTEATALAEFETRPVPDADLVPWRPGLEEFGSHLLAAGYPRAEFAAPASFPVLLSLPEGSRARVVARYAPDARRILLDGFMMDEDRPVLAGRPFLVVNPVGRGRVIAFAEDPTFRGAWYGMNLLFLNALVFGPVL